MATTGKIPIFLTGATGYIGGTVLARLLAHPDAGKFEITVIVRSDEKAEKLEKFGVKAVVGSFKTDLDLVKKLAEAAHIVFHCADANDVSAAKAILHGLRKRHDRLGDIPHFIHTSGTGVLTAVEKSIWDDSDANSINSLPPDAEHRPVDLAVIQADKEGYVRTYIILPSTIYGRPSHALANAGISNTHSVALPILTKVALARGRAGMLGDGRGTWANVHIDDTAELYMVLANALLHDSKAVDHGVNGYYIAGNGEHTWYELSRAIGDALVALGVHKEAEPTAFTDEELVKFFGSVERAQALGTTCRVQASHSRSLGWEPKYTREDMFKSVKPEVEALLKQNRQQK